MCSTVDAPGTISLIVYLVYWHNLTGMCEGRLRLVSQLGVDVITSPTILSCFLPISLSQHYHDYNKIGINNIDHRMYNIIIDITLRNTMLTPSSLGIY